MSIPSRRSSGVSATIATVAVVALLYWARALIIPVALAVLLSFILSPIVLRLHRRGLNRLLAVLVTVTAVSILVGGVGTLLARQVTQLAATLPERREAIKEKLLDAKHAIVGEGRSGFGQLVDDVSEIVSPTPQEPVVVVKSPTFGHQIEEYVGPAAEILGQAAFTCILTFFMLLRHEDLRNRAIRLIGDGRIMATTRAVDDASRRISRFLLSQLLLNSAFGLVIAVVLFLLGVPFAILWGVLGGMLRYVPYVGTWVGMLLPLAFSITTAPGWGGGWGQPICVLALYVVLEIVANNLEPRLYGRSMGVSEVAQLVAAAGWAFLWGPVGLILSGPLTACLIVLGRHVPRFHFLVVLLGDEPPLKPRTAFYQRLAARDQDEAAEVARAVVEKSDVNECFDHVLIPALCRARHDAESGELDSANLNFILAATRETAEELAEDREWSGEAADDAVKILVCPAREKSEHVAATIFASTLDPRRWDVEVVGDEMVAAELVERVEEHQPAAVVIATLPPGGLSHANYLIARLRRRFPDLSILIGRWGADEAPRTLRGADQIGLTLAETRRQMDGLHAVFAASRTAAMQGAI
jgi:predicted PurR-regulated permease PerM